MTAKRKEEKKNEPEGQLPIHEDMCNSNKPKPDNSGFAKTATGKGLAKLLQKCPVMEEAVTKRVSVRSLELTAKSPRFDEHGRSKESLQTWGGKINNVGLTCSRTAHFDWDGSCENLRCNKRRAENAKKAT